jgi:hypothetical protein
LSRFPSISYITCSSFIAFLSRLHCSPLTFPNIYLTNMIVSHWVTSKVTIPISAKVSRSLSHMPYPACLIMPALSCLSYPACPILPVLSRLPCPAWPILQILSCLFCPFLSCLACPACLSCMPCFTHPVLPVLYHLPVVCLPGPASPVLLAYSPIQGTCSPHSTIFQQPKHCGGSGIRI